MAGWVGTGIALPGTHPPYPGPHYPGYTPPPTAPVPGTAPGLHRGVQQAVGLRSVAQLTLSAQISEIRGITEVYNLVKAGDPNDHKFIPGTE